MVFWTRPLALGAALACALTVSLHAQSDGSALNPAERQALMSHKLTLDNIRKMADASVKLTELSKKDPTLGDVREGDEAKNLTQLVAKMDALPPVKSAIASSGLTTSEWVLTMFELQMVNSAFVMKQVGGEAAQGAENLPVSAENMEFFTSHHTEIEPYLKALDSDDGKEDE